MNQAPFFEAGDDFHVPSRFGFHPGLEGCTVARVTHSRRGHYANLVNSVRLHGALEPLEGAQSRCHGLWSYQSGLEYARAQSRYLAILGEGS